MDWKPRDADPKSWPCPFPRVNDLLSVRSILVTHWPALPTMAVLCRGRHNLRPSPAWGWGYTWIFHIITRGCVGWPSPLRGPFVGHFSVIRFSNGLGLIHSLSGEAEAEVAKRKHFLVRRALGMQIVNWCYPWNLTWKLYFVASVN